LMPLITLAIIDITLLLHYYYYIDIIIIIKQATIPLPPPDTTHWHHISHYTIATHTYWYWLLFTLFITFINDIDYWH
jgi:hypothetical protein